MDRHSRRTSSAEALLRIAVGPWRARKRSEFPRQPRLWRTRCAAVGGCIKGATIWSVQCLDMSNSPDDRDLRLLSLTDLHIDRMLSDRGSSRIRILEQRLAFTQATHGVIHEASMDVLSKLLQSLKVNGRSHEIEKHLRAAIKLVEANYGLEGPVAWKAVDRLAALIAKVRNVDGLGLEPHLRSAAVGPTQPSSRDSLSNFALLLEAKGPAMTEKTMRDNLVGKQETLGLAHPSTLTLLCNLARVLQVRGQVEEAERLLRAGVTESEMLLGAHSLCTLTFLNNLALVLQQPIGSPEAAIEETRREEATTTLRRAVEGFTAVLERGHRSTLLVAENYAEALEAVGNDSEATEAFEETYFIARGSLGRLHPDTLRYLDGLCRRHEAFGRSEEALKLRRSAWEEADRAQQAAQAFRAATTRALDDAGPAAAARSGARAHLRTERGRQSGVSKDAGSHDPADEAATRAATARESRAGHAAAGVNPAAAAAAAPAAADAALQAANEGEHSANATSSDDTNSSNNHNSSNKEETTREEHQQEEEEEEEEEKL
eukprot:CAMPEP_0206532602 /NCGR_PEP_ID=MMETSP0325_2-20121206/4482_1 /ASSEMBLY_ACC=CAM_ASM_000347 /TAXON_ID=2866 /ORGANISM="Crypthecodinium cohnii, Strain Seligo" /LENGTH=545 /DNA_ID=CAMNT_0054029115 /DNA_START=595 /DNA_END=2227 /DNA_ORIENTATION=-